MNTTLTSAVHGACLRWVLVCVGIPILSLCFVACEPAADEAGSSGTSQQHPGDVQMRSYTVKRASSKVPLSEQVAGTAWSDAESLSIDNYPWFKSGRKEATTVRLLYDEKALYVQFLCADDTIYAERTQINSSVCTDSCVEFFAMPAPELDDRYFNLEINCAGTFLLGWGRNVQEILAGFVDPELSTKYLKIATSVEGPKKQE